jgi:hypothetical protein
MKLSTLYEATSPKHHRIEVSITAPPPTNNHEVAVIKQTMINLHKSVLKKFGKILLEAPKSNSEALSGWGGPDKIGSDIQYKKYYTISKAIPANVGAKNGNIRITIQYTAPSKVPAQSKPIAAHP